MKSSDMSAGVKRSLCLVVLTLGMMMGLYAQPKVPRELQFAALGGVNMSSYTFNPSVTQDQSLGYVAGVGVRYIEEKYFGLQCELLMARRGIKDRYDNYPEYHFERTLTYVELPLMAHVYFNMGKRNEVAFDVGPKLAYYLYDGTSGNLDSGFDLTRAEHQYAHHDMDVSQRLDYGIQAGLGYEFKFSRQLSLQVQGRYYFGLGDMFPSTKADTFETSSNQSVQIVMALWFHHNISLRKMMKRMVKGE